MGQDVLWAKTYMSILDYQHLHGESWMPAGVQTSNICHVNTCGHDVHECLTPHGRLIPPYPMWPWDLADAVEMLTFGHVNDGQ